MNNSTHGQFHLWKIPLTSAPITETTHKGFAKYAVDAKLFRLGSSILKRAGSRGTASVEVMGGKATHNFFFLSQLDEIL